MDDAVDAVLCQQFPYPIEIADVGPYEPVVWGILDVFQIGEIARIGQFVEVDDEIVGVLRHEKPHDMRPDESRTARDEDAPFSVHILSDFADGF